MDSSAPQKSSVALDIGMGIGTALWYALPDVVERRWVRGLIKTGSLAGVAAVAAARADLDPGEQPAPDLDPALAEAGPWKIGGLVAASSVLSLAGTVAGDRLIKRGVSSLRGRGVRWPHSVIGAGIGAATALGRPSRHVLA